MNPLSFLKSGLDKLNLELSREVLEKILSYVELLQKWNKVYNLTAIDDPKSIIIRHIFDSLSVKPFIVGPNILDFGTGAGFPGLPLALALPEYSFVLLDSVRKKTTFLNHVVFSLNIKNVEIVNKSIEKFRFDPGFATIVTRATMKTNEIINKVEHLIADSGEILIMKGKDPTKELAGIARLFKLHRIEVPCLEEERHLIRVL